MRTFFISLSLIAVVIATVWQLGEQRSEDASPKEARDNSEINSDGLLSVLASAPAPSQKTAVRSPNAHTNADEFVSKAAPNIKLLPLAQQQEIKRLSGRDNPDSNIVEVQPGVFLMTDGPKVVPVAVVNADGSVTVHEY